jgi:hypothetical protein
MEVTILLNPVSSLRKQSTYAIYYWVKEVELGSFSLHYCDCTGHVGHGWCKRGGGDTEWVSGDNNNRISRE